MRWSICPLKAATIALSSCDGFTRRDAGEARRDLAAWLLRWQEKYPKLCAWVEENIEETLTFYRLPREHHKPLKSTNMLERINQELKRRTHVIRIFPNQESALRLIRALAVEIHEDWIEAHRYLNMEMLREQRKQLQLLEPPKVHATAYSQTGCSGVAPAPELCPCGAPAAATSPCRAFVNKPHLFSQLLSDLPFC
jgi:Transposase, Mutator family